MARLILNQRQRKIRGSPPGTARGGRPITIRSLAALRLEPTQLASVLTHSFRTRLHLVQRTAGSGVLLDNAIGFGGPLEGLRAGVALGNPSLDCSYQLIHALEHTTTDALARDLRKQALDEVDPGR